MRGVLLITLQKKKKGGDNYKRKKRGEITTKEKKGMKIFEKIGFFHFRIAKYFEKI